MFVPIQALRRIPYAAMLVAAMTIPFLLGGCAATQLAISKADLDVQTKMSATVFLEPVSSQKQRMVFVQVRNSSDRADFDVSESIHAALAAKGYVTTPEPDQAHYMLMVNVLQVGKIAPTAAQSLFTAGYGAPLGGGLAVAATGAAFGMTNYKGLLGLGIAGAIVETVANAAVKDVYFSAITDVQVRERHSAGAKSIAQTAQSIAQGTGGGTTIAYAEQSDWKIYQTRVLSTANKVNLEFSEAAPPLRAGLTRSIVGMF